MPGAPQLDWKVLAWVAGASFMANMVAFFAAANFLIAPVRAATDTNTADIKLVRTEVAQHSNSAHPVTVERFKSIDDKLSDMKADILWIRNNLK